MLETSKLYVCSGKRVDISKLMAWLTYDSESTMEAADLLKLSGVPLVSPGATAPQLLDKDRSVVLSCHLSILFVLVCSRISVPFHFGSPFSSKVVVCGHCLVTLSLTINETLKWLSSLPILRCTNTAIGPKPSELIARLQLAWPMTPVVLIQCHSWPGL